MLRVIAGAQRFAHTNQLRSDRALHFAFNWRLRGERSVPHSDWIEQVARAIGSDHADLKRRFEWQCLLYPETAAAVQEFPISKRDRWPIHYHGRWSRDRRHERI